MKLIFLSLKSPEEAIARVALRVRQGGHDIPPDVIRRRFAAGLRNFLDVYRARVGPWRWFDNGGPAPSLLEEGAERNDPDMQAAPRALMRAAHRAREIAMQTYTAIVIVRDGVLVEERVTKADLKACVGLWQTNVRAGFSPP